MNTNNELIIPIYINEKVVLDMLAIIDDGFSMVSQVNYSEDKNDSGNNSINAGVGTATLLSKLLKIDISGGITKSKSIIKKENVATEKIHTNVSLLSKLRKHLIDNKFLEDSYDIEKIKIGDFIEVEGELEKNPLINCLDIFEDIIRMVEIFEEQPELGNRTQAKMKKQEENESFKQIKNFTKELKHTGTIDFILKDGQSTVILSAQEQYLSNDNISEIIGGRFKILGKVIKICKDKNDSIDLLRKTSLSVLPDEMINTFFKVFDNEELKDYKLPRLITTIGGPAIIVIPVAIYA